MKYLKNYLSVIAVAALAVAACDKTTVPEYEPAEGISSEQVFFPASVVDEYKIPDGETSFTIPVQRGTANLEALDVEISASGEGIEYFTVPGVVSFASQAKTANLTITVTDVAVLGKNNFYDLTLTIADKALTTPYGRSSVTISAGIELPWIKFDTGTYFSFWTDAELERTVEYQQLTETMRYCRIQNFWDDEDNPMDIFWYWDTQSNYCYVLPTILEPYNGENNCVMSDMASFYTKYQGWEGDVGTIGSDQWFTWAGPWMASRNDIPYYDGNGTFYLADWFYIAATADGVPTGRGWQFGGGAGAGDWFKGASFGDYSLSLSYDGMYVSPEGEAVPILSFASTKESAKYYDTVKYVITDQETDASETVAAIAAGEIEDVQTITLSDMSASIQPEIEPGLYRLVAVPFVAGDQNDKGESTEYKTLYAQSIDFYFPGLDVAPKEVEGAIHLMDMESLFGKETCEQNGYYDYNSIGFVIEGKEIKSAVRGLFKTSVANNYPIETLVANCTALTDAQIASINERGYYANGFINLEAETSYTFVVELTNIYGSTKTYTATYETATMPYSGELVIGDYTITGSEDTNVVTLSPTETENAFIVYNLGIENGAGWNAVYDPEALTLTLDGTEYGYESYGNQFGALYGYYNSDHTMVYGIAVYNSDDSEGDDALVFSVDVSSKQLKLINQDVEVFVYGYEDGEVTEYLGDYSYLEAGSPVTYNATASGAAAKKTVKASVTTRNSNSKKLESNAIPGHMQSPAEISSTSATWKKVATSALSQDGWGTASTRVHRTKTETLVNFELK